MKLTCILLLSFNLFSFTPKKKILVDAIVTNKLISTSKVSVILKNGKELKIDRKNIISKNIKAGQKIQFHHTPKFFN